MDIIDLYSRIPVGASVKIDRGGLPMEAKSMPEYVYVPPVRTLTTSTMMMATLPAGTKDTRVAATR